MTILGDGLAALLGVIVALLAALAVRVVDGLDRQGQRAPGVRVARAASVPVGLAAAAALWMPAGAAAALLTVPYVLVAGLLGLHGAGALALRRGQGGDLAMAAGLVLWPGGALWLLAHRAGFPLLGYPPVWVGLTAAHFHVAGAFLPLIVGRAAIDRGRAARVVALAIALGVPLTAAGIAGPRWLETATAVAMTCAGLGGAVVLLTTPRPSARLAGGVLCATMLLAGQYAVRGAAPAFRLGDWDPLTSMVIVHGSLNVVGVGLVGLWSAWRAGPRAVLDPPPFSRLRGGWRIGPDFFPVDDTRQPAGLLDRLDELAHPDLDVGLVAPAIRRFYEHTGVHAMVVRPTWRRGVRTGARLWHQIARQMGQLDLPVTSESGREGVTTRIVAIDATADGRAAPRAWIRQFADGRAMYVAGYATHRHGERAYMNIAFPLLGGSFASILRMDNLGHGVRVSTRTGDDAGIYYVLRLGRWTVPIRLPMSETIDVWDRGDDAAPAATRGWAGAEATTIACHTVWLAGIAIVRLDYAMREA